MSPEDIKAADRLARKSFTYKSEAGDTWRSRADEALAGTAWQGDCDDLASTVLDILGRQGLPLESRYRLVVASAGDKRKPDHLAGCAIANDGSFLIVGDTFRAAYAAPAMRHRGIFYNRLSENQPDAIWREGVPWK